MGLSDRRVPPTYNTQTGTTQTGRLAFAAGIEARCIDGYRQLLREEKPRYG